MAFFQPGRRPRVKPRRLGVLRTVTVRTSVTGWVQPMDGLARLRYLGVSA